MTPSLQARSRRAPSKQSFDRNPPSSSPTPLEDAISKPARGGKPPPPHGDWTEAGAAGPAPSIKPVPPPPPPFSIGARTHTRTHSSLFIPEKKELGWEGRTGAEPGARALGDARETLSFHPKERHSPPPNAAADAKAAPICSARVTPVAIFIRGCLRGSSRFILSPLS